MINPATQHPASLNNHLFRTKLIAKNFFCNLKNYSIYLHAKLLGIINAYSNMQPKKFKTVLTNTNIFDFVMSFLFLTNMSINKKLKIMPRTNERTQ